VIVIFTVVLAIVYVARGVLVIFTFSILFACLIDRDPKKLVLDVQFYPSWQTDLAT
jgi:hypothetical protein